MWDDPQLPYSTLTQEPWELPSNPGTGDRVGHETGHASGERSIRSIDDHRLIVEFKEREHSAWPKHPEHLVQNLLWLIHVHQHALGTTEVEALRIEVETPSISDLSRHPAF